MYDIRYATPYRALMCLRVKIAPYLYPTEQRFRRSQDQENVIDTLLALI